MADDKLENLVGEYAELAKENKNIDAAALIESAFQQEDNSRISPKTRKWAYLLSLAIPPLGLLFGAVFLLGDRSDRKSVAYICMALTAISLIASIVLMKAVFNSAGVSPAQIQQIKPADIYQLTQ